MDRNGIIDMLREDMGAWEFGIFEWGTGDIMIFNEDKAKEYLVLKRQVKVTKQIILDREAVNA
jgi:hypothetical protein